uniref:Lon proteolytic domain-containing protein n=1 Tax=Globodera pallida TaxID=36090 RepID=A0A183BWN4_GLOPA
MPIHALDIMGSNTAHAAVHVTGAGIKAMVMPKANMRELQRLETENKGEVRPIHSSHCSQLWAEMLEEE